MKSTLQWSMRASPEADGSRPACLAIAFRPDGTQVIAACGTRVNIYDTQSGELLHTLKGHRESIYCVSYCADGKSFASGGADKQVFMWTNRGEGLLRYPHHESIQAIEFNPVTNQLASVTATDFGLWSSSRPTVHKTRLASKGLCCSWTADGQHLAIGMYGGTVSIRSRQEGVEKAIIKRNGPVWSMAWSPKKEEGAEVLCVASWDRKLAFFHISGSPIGKEKELNYDPCSVAYFQGGDYLVVSGADRKASLHAKDGTFLVPVADHAHDWVWMAKTRPKANQIIISTNDGTIASYQLTFSTVHSIYQEQYVFRELMTDVTLQLLTVERKLKIHCKDYVKKLAIYRDRLAVQLQDKIVIYELYYDDQYDLKCRPKEKIQKKLDCSLMCVTASNVILCQDKRLTSYDFFGNKRREWMMDTVIRYIKVIGGLTDRESLLVGLRNGSVLKIFVDNAFPVLLLKLQHPVRCLDLSASRMKLAVVDDSYQLQVYKLGKTADHNELLFSEPNANAVSWNMEYEDMVCWTGKDTLHVKTGDLVPYQQRLPGFVVGFKGNKIFCLYYSTMSSVDVPHSHALHRYVERKEYKKAYEIACLGVTEDDWQMLGLQAMTGLALDIARKCFIRIKDIKFVELLNRVEMDRKYAGGDDSFLLGEILAFQGKYQEAAKCFIKGGLDGKAIEMFCDLKMWDEAKKVCSNEDHLKDLIRRQARWAEDTGDTVEASKLYLAAGDFERAIRLMGEKGAVEPLIEVCRTLPKTDTKAIGECGRFLRDYGALEYAKEAYEKIGDYQAMLQLHVDQGEWDEAFALLHTYPQYAGDVYVPYAAYLATQGRFEEAQDAFKKAAQPEKAIRMMEQLAANAVVTQRFTEAAFYYFKLSQDTALSVKGILQNLRLQQQATPGKGKEEVKLSDADMADIVAKRDRFMHKAEIYYAYDMIYKYISRPFTSEEPTWLFNAAKYLLTATADVHGVPKNVKRLQILLALSRLTTGLDMFRLARHVYEKLQQYVLPPALVDQIDVETLLMRGRPYEDREDLLPVCYRCGQTNVSIATTGDRCSNCLHPFIRSFHSFEVLPLVEFTIEESMTDSDAEAMLMGGGGKKMRNAAQEQWKQNEQGGADVITFNDELVDAALGNDTGNRGDPFSRQVVQMEIQGHSNSYRPIVCSADNLRQLKSDDVFIVKRGWGVLPMANQYFRNMVPSVGITLCKTCCHFFRDDDYEFESLKGGGCPFCRTKLGDGEEKA